jgi:hypothetical protein
VTLYRVCNLTFASDRRLRELEPLARGTIDWTLRYETPRRRSPWFRHTRLDDGRLWMSVACHQQRYLLRVSRLALFELDFPARVIRYAAIGQVAPATIRHLLLDQVLPLVAGSPRRVALHASGVVSPRGAVLFVGNAGRGKSTLAALLAGAGWPILSDDCLLIEERRSSLVALPSYPGVRLNPDTLGALFRGARRRFGEVAAYTAKRRVATTALPFADAGALLTRVYLIGAAGAHTRRPAIIRDCPPRRAMLELVKQALCLDARDRARAGEIFHLAASIVQRATMRSIRFDWDLSRLGEIRDAVMEDVVVTS